MKKTWKSMDHSSEDAYKGNMEELNTIGKRLRFLRESAGYTQEILAGLLYLGMLHWNDNICDFEIRSFFS